MKLLRATLALAACAILAQHAGAARRKYGRPKATGASQAEAVVQPDPAKAVSENAEALKLAQSGKLTDALPRFEAAAALDPGNSEYMNNVGVTLMRLGKLQAAKAQFEAALQSNPGNELASENLRDLQQYLVQQSGTSTPSEPENAEEGAPVPVPTPLSNPAAAPEGPQAPWTGKDKLVQLRHKIRPMPRIPLAELYSPQHWKYRTGQHPFILTGVTEQASWANSKHRQWTPEYLSSKFPTSMVDFYPHNMERESVSPIFQPLPTALQELRATRGTQGNFMKSLYTPNSTYIQWNMNLQEWNSLMSDLGPFPQSMITDDLWIEGALESDAEINNFQKASHWRMLLIGNRHAGMFNHWDILRSSSYQFQAAGRKLWHICPPSEWDRMYKAGDVNTFNPLYERFPKFLDADCVLGVAQPGDMLWYPRDYWHHTYNVDDWNVAFTSTLADGYNTDTLAAEFDSECRGVTNRLPGMTKETCRKLTSAYDFWRQAFTGTYKGQVSEQEAERMLAANKRVRRGKGVGTFESIGQCARSVA